MAQFASDDFTGTAGTELSAYNSAWTEHPSYSTGNFILSDANRVRRNTNNATCYYHSGTPASADYTVSAILFAKTTDGGTSNTGVCGRINTSANTLYLAQYEGSSTDGWKLFKAVAGTFTQLGSTVTQTFTDETSKEVILSMVGTTIELYKEGSGTPTISVSDSAISAAGKAGIRISGTSESDTQGLHIDSFSADDVGGAATHPTSGALTAGAATVAGTAAHLTLHATSGALSSQAAAIAGAALHPHLSTGALAAQSAVVAGSAELTPDGGTHATSGALAAASATVEGSATHLALHTTTGALSAQAAALDGSAAHLTLHTSTGALAAGEATVSGAAAHTGAGATSPMTGAGRPSRTRRPRVVEIDGEDFVVNSAEEAEALLDSAREQARQLAATAVKRAAAAERRPARKVIADARRLLETPEINAPEDLRPMVEQARADIDAIYQSALASVEIAALMARRQREEEDDEDVLLLIA